MPVEDAIYLAALVDGEGSIGERRGGIRVRIGMTAVELVKDLCEEWGGCIYAKHPKNPRHKPSLDWYIEEKDKVRSFLQKISPYLRLKGPHAALALRMLKIDKKAKGWKDEWNVLAEELGKLNEKGASNP